MGIAAFPMPPFSWLFPGPEETSMQVLLFPRLFRERCKGCSEGTMPNQADAPTYMDTYFSQGTGDAFHGVLKSLFNQARSHLQINLSYTHAILVIVLLLVEGRGAWWRKGRLGNRAPSLQGPAGDPAPLWLDYLPMPWGPLKAL